MSAAMTPALLSLETRLQDLHRFIVAATQKLDAGMMVNLQNLQADVAQLCSDIARADPYQAPPMKPLLAETIAALDTLEQALIAHQQRLRSS